MLDEILSPGLRYILTTLVPQTIIPIVSVYAAAHRCVLHLTLIENGFLLHLLSLLILLLVANLLGTLQAVNKRRLARQHNAVPIPAIRGRLLGNLDIMSKMIRGFKHYSYHWMGELEEQHGVIYNLRLLGSDVVSARCGASVKLH